MMTHAKQLLQSIQGKALTQDERIELAIQLAASMLQASDLLLTKKERTRYQMFSRMMQDQSGKAFFTAMTDASFRSHDPKAIVEHFQHLLQLYGTPEFLDLPKRLALQAFRSFGHFFPKIATQSLLKLLRKETQEVILPGEENLLIKHLILRKKEGVRINLNRLGEAILGEAEALARLQMLIDDLKNPHIEVISVKISSIFSQINLLAHDSTLAILKERLRQLYRECKKHTPYKFVNLDMEEYRDLDMTCTLFQETLSEPEFFDLSCGLALQSYIPDSHLKQKALTEWAIQRVEKGGAPIHIRLVKGANLGMEKVEASIKGWPQAPYLKKEETDANFKRMCDYGMERDRAKAVHLGIGSHNLFDIAYALILRNEKQSGENLQNRRQ